MTAVINTAAQFYQQFDQPVDLDTYVPLDCTIVNVLTDGSRVSVVITDPSQAAQTPSGVWRENNIPYVQNDTEPPSSGYFVAPVGYTPTAPVTLSSIAWTMPNGASVVGDGSTQLPYTITATFSDESTQNVTSTATLTFAPTTGLTGSAGNLVGSTAGSYTVTATYEGVTANQTVAVTAPT